MDRPTKLMLISAAAAALISAAHASSISLQEPADAPASQVYSLTVENGKPSGHYEAGTQVVVSADQPPTGAEFARWTGDIAILANPFLSSTTATIPFTAVTITATYTEPQTVAAGTDETPAAAEAAPAPSASPAPAAKPSWEG
jgi:Divergent InlB B-repeat domain